MVNQNRTETNSNPKRMVRFPSLIQGDWRLYTGSYITGCSLQNKQQPSVPLFGRANTDRNEMVKLSAVPSRRAPLWGGLRVEYTHHLTLKQVTTTNSCDSALMHNAFTHVETASTVLCSNKASLSSRWADTKTIVLNTVWY